MIDKNKVKRIFDTLGRRCRPDFQSMGAFCLVYVSLKYVGVI